MKNIMITLSLIVCSTVLNVRADESLNTAPSMPESSVASNLAPSNTNLTEQKPSVAPKKEAGYFACLAQITFKKAFAVVAAAGIIATGLYTLYEFLTAGAPQDETHRAEQPEMLTLTDQQRKLIDDFAAAVDACDLVAIQAFDFEEFPIDIMLLLHWARMDVLAVHEQQADQEAVELYRHSMALALRGLAHPDDMPACAATKDLAPDCA